MRVGVDSARKNIAAFGVYFRVGLHGQISADRLDFFIRDKEVGVIAIGRRDDRSVLNQNAFHVFPRSQMPRKIR